MGLENPLHIAIVLIVVLMVFGAKRLPEMGKGLGEGMRGFKSALGGDSHSDLDAHVQQLSAAPQPATTATTASATTASDTEERAPEPVA